MKNQKIGFVALLFFSMSAFSAGVDSSMVESKVQVDLDNLMSRFLPRDQYLIQVPWMPTVPQLCIIHSMLPVQHALSVMSGILENLMLLVLHKLVIASTSPEQHA